MEKCFEHWYASLFTMKFGNLCHTAKFDERPPPRLFRRQSGAQVVFDVHCQMALQLFGEFALSPPVIKQTEMPHEPAAQLSNVHCDSLPVVVIQCGAQSSDPPSSPAALECKKRAAQRRSTRARPRRRLAGRLRS